VTRGGGDTAVFLLYTIYREYEIGGAGEMKRAALVVLLVLLTSVATMPGPAAAGDNDAAI